MKRIVSLLGVLIVFFMTILIPNTSALDMNLYDSVIHRISVYSDNALDLKDILDKETSYFEIGGRKVEEGSIFKAEYGENFKFYLEWKILNGTSLTSEDYYYYELPDGIIFNDMSGSLKDGINEVGEYSLVDNVLIIRYNDEFLNNKDSNNDVKGTLAIEGFLTGENLWKEDDDTYDVEFPGFGTFTLDIIPKPDNSSISITKECLDEDLDDDVTEFLIKISVTDQIFKNLIIDDEFGIALSNIQEFVITDAEGNELYFGEDYIIVDENDSEIYIDDGSFDGNHFFIKFFEVRAGDEFQIKYKMNIDEDLALDEIKNVKNLAIAYIEGNDLKYYSEANAKIQEESSISKSVVIDGDIARYTIIVYGKSRLSEQTIKDEMSEGQEYIEGSFKVTENDKDFYGLTFEELQKGYQFTESNKIYHITYETRITCDDCFIDNAVNLQTRRGVISSETNEYYNEVSLDKKVLNFDKESRTITWEVTFDYKHSNVLEDFDINLADEFDKDKLEYVEDSFEIDNKKYEVSLNSIWENGGFKLSVKDSQIGSGPHTIVYQTKVKDGVELWNLWNEISLNLFGEYSQTFTTRASYSDEEILSAYITKNYLDSSNAYNYNDWISYKENEHGMRFVIKIRKLEESVNDFYIIDELPANTTVLLTDYITLKPANDSTLPSYDVWPYTLDVPISFESLDGNKVKIVFKNESILNSLKQDEYYLIYSLEADKSLYGSYSFVNKAKAVVNGEEKNYVNCSVNKVFNPPLTKNFAYDSNTAPAAIYTIKLNEYGLDLDPDSDELVLYDQSGTGIDFVRGTLRVNGKIHNNYSYDDETHQLIIRVPDEQPIELTYTTYINLKPGTQFTADNGSNSIKIDGVDGTPVSQMYGSVIEVNGTSSGSGGSISIYKYTNNDLNDSLGGIKFKLYKANIIDDNGKVTIDKTDAFGDLFTEITTSSSEDSKGYARISGLSFDQVYVIHEEESSEYYPIDDIYFVIAGHNENEYDNENIKIISNEINNYTFNIHNREIKKEILISKVDENDKMLRGATLQILDKDNNVIEEWTTDDKEYMVKKKLTIGETYTLHEEKAPKGYKVADDIEFTVEEDLSKVQKIKMVDIKIKEPIIKVTKVDENDKMLSGAKLQILDENNNVIEEWLTDDKAHIVENKLTIGETYILHEESAPKGYKLAKDIKFIVEDTEEVQELKMIDSKIKIKEVASVETGDTKVIKYAIVSILTLLALILGVISYKKFNKKQI